MQKLYTFLSTFLFLISSVLAVAQPAWNVVVTGSSHTIVIETAINPTINGLGISVGDYIGVFFDQNGTLVCGGKAAWTGNNIALTAYGDDLATPTKDGFAVNEAFNFKIWRASDTQEGNATATYKPLTTPPFSHQGNFADNGLSGLASLTGTISNAPLPLLAPSNLVAIATGATVISLSWLDNSVGETGFEIYMATSATGTFTAMSTTAANSTTAQITGLLPLTTYFFKIKAIRNTANSSDSNIASATTLNIGNTLPTDWAPPTPQASSHTVVIEASINPTIDGVPLQNGSIIGVFYLTQTGYKPAGLVTWAGITATLTVYGDDATTTSIREGMLLNENFIWKIKRQPDNLVVDINPTYVVGTPYTHTNQFANNGLSGLSGLQATTILVSPPSNLVATILSSYQIKLDFQDNSNNEDGFVVFRSTISGQAYSILDTLAANLTTYTDSTGLPDLAYFYKVVALKGNYTSTASNEVSAKLQKSATVSIDNKTAICGDILEVPFRAKDFKKIGGLTFLTEWNSSQLEFLEVIDFRIPNANVLNNFDYTNSSNGSLRFFWDRLPLMDNLTIANDSILFKVKFFVLASNTNSEIKFSTNSSANIVRSGNSSIMEFNGQNGLVAIQPTNHSIRIDSVSSKFICGNAAIKVYYTVSPNFALDNFFTLELSDEFGNFILPTQLVSFDSNISGFVQVVIPSNLPQGNAYRLRMVASHPCYTSPDNGINLTLLNAPNLQSAIEIKKIDVKCFGERTGSAEAFFNCDLPVNRYEWSNGQVGKANGSIGAGTYSVKVFLSPTDYYTASVTITQPDLLAITGEIILVSANSTTNKINLITRGGTQPYSYLWTLPNGSNQTTEDIDNLSAGLHTVLVTDALGCTTTKSFLITVPNPIVINIKKTENPCQNAKVGTANATITGGIAPYTIQWNSGQTTANLTDLANGSYEIKVTDARGISASKTTTIGSPTGTPKLSYTKTIYTFADGIISPMLENVRYGRYSITPNGAVIDSAGKVNLEQSIVNRTYTVRYSTGVAVCDTAKFTFQLVATDSLLVVPIVSLSDCFDSKNGSVRLNISTKALPVKVRWSTGDTTATISNLGYTTSPLTVNVFDANGKKVSLKINLPVPKGSPKISYAKNNYCNTETNPKATIEGLYNYGFASQPQGIVFLDSGTIDLQKSKTGNYNVIVATPAGCIANTTINIFGLPTKQFNNKTIIACSSTVLDAANSNLSNATYRWSTGETTQRITVTKSGTYIVTINSGLCQILDTIKVQISNLVATTKVTHLRGNGSIANGEIDVTNIVGNIGNATIMWADIPSVQRKRTGLKAGIYEFTVKDTLCPRTYKVEIKAPIVLKVTAEKQDDTGCGGANGSITLKITGNGNEKVTIDGKTVTNGYLGGLKAGFYKWTVIDSTDQNQSGDILLASADPLATNLRAFDASCIDDGKVILDTKGGRKPYTYEYTDVVTGTVKTATSNEISGLAVTANEYIFVITDATGCKVVARTRIRKAPIPTLTISDTTTICEGATTSFSVRYKGSVYPYSFSYSANRENFTVNNVMDSSFKVEVSPKIATIYKITRLSYGANCTGTIAAAQAWVKVNPLPVLLNVQATQENCGLKDATILLSEKDVTAGKAPFEFAIQKTGSKDNLNFAKTTRFENLAAGSYEVFVREANSCVYKYPKVVEIQNESCEIEFHKLPNTITPNGDGINDTFVIPNAQFYPEMTLEVQDRVGRVIYKGIYKDWNPNETNETIGVYFYQIVLGNGKTYQRFINVLR